MINEELTKNYSLKVLFGPMYGCELHLPENNYFLIVNPASGLQNTASESVTDNEHAVHYAENTLFIPCDLNSPNISLYLSDCYQDDIGDYFYIEIHDENGQSHKSSFRKNEVFIYGHIKLAIKNSDDEWADNINNHQSLPLIIDKEFDYVSMITKRKKFATVIAGILICTIFLLSGIFLFYKISENQQIITLSEALSGSPAPLEVVKDRDNKKIYILAHKSLEMAWAKEAIHKMNNKDNFPIILLSKSKIEIISELAKLGYPILQFDFSSPLDPVLAIHRALTPKEELDLRSIILKKIPYALNLEFIIKTKEQLLDDARQGLDRLNIHYRLINTSAGYSLVIRDNLSDNVLNSLYQFINNFTDQWGNTVITFPINLDENWLQNKSYVDSTKGYLFLNPRHWYFSLNNKDF